MKRITCVFLAVVFLVAMANVKPARADGFSVGAALLGGFLIGTIWAPRVITAPPTIYGPVVQYYYPQPQYRPQYRYRVPLPQAHYQAPAYYPPPPSVTVCAQDMSGDINCRTIQY